MLEFKQINKAFDGKTVAEHINLTVADGQLLAILGPSGCGKSTLLNLAAGLLEPDSGEIWLNNQNCTHVAPEKRRVALMFQDYALFPHLNVWQNVAFGLKMQSVTTQEARQRAERMLIQVGLGREAERRIDSLSSGEQQRVALARSLVISPYLLLLDEPFSSLDTGLRQQLRNQTLNLIRAQNIPAVLVTHDPEEAFALADHIALMRSGRFIQQDIPDVILEKPTNEWAARLIGCQNVTSIRYVPQKALHFNHPQGIPCRLLHVLRQPEYCRLIFPHPQYGEIWLNLDWSGAANLDLREDTVWPVYVDDAQVVYFKKDVSRFSAT